MGPLQTTAWAATFSLLALWLIIAAILAWRNLWSRRKHIDQGMTAAAATIGETYRPITHLRWAWMLLASIPTILFLSLIWLLIILLYIPLGIWALCTGKLFDPPNQDLQDNPPT
jgi:hypothetical protein